MFKRIRTWLGERRTTPSLGPRDVFLAEVEAIARTASNIADVDSVDAETAFALDLTTTDGETHRLFLDNLFRESRDLSPAERRRRILVGLPALEDDDLSWEDARSRLVPILRGATFPNVARSQILEAAKDPSPNAFVRKSFAPFIDILPVIDLPTKMVHIHRDALSKWRVSEDEVLEAALAAGSRRLAEGSPSIYDQTHGPLFVLSTDDMYESSRLLVPGWLASFRAKVEGAPVAIVPHASLLMVGGSGRPEMISRLVEMAAREFDASPRTISPSLYTVDESDRVVPYAADTIDVRMAEYKLASWEYARQKEVLDESQEEFFIATYNVERTKEGIVRTRAVWTDTVETLLPRTDCVSLVTVSPSADGSPRYGVPCVVPWDVIAHRLAPANGFRPTRFRTGAFPNEEELAALRADYPD